MTTHAISITKGAFLSDKGRESLFLAGAIGTAFLLAAAFSPPATISDEEARGYVMDAQQVLAAREENPGAVLVGVGCGPNGDQIILAAEESDFLFGCQAIEAHYLPE